MFENTNKNLFLSGWTASEDGTTIYYKPTSDILEKYRAVFKAVFPRISVDPTTPQGQIITALTEQDTNDLALIADMANSFFTGGDGIWLDDWAFMMFRLNRKDGTPSSVTIDVEGSAGAIIESGFMVSDGTLNYEFKGTYNIPENGKGTITCICTEITERESIAGSVKNIITPTQGIYRVTNPNNSIPAILVESDSEFADRCLEYGSSFNNTSLRSIASAVMGVKGVIKVNSYENPSFNKITFKGTEFDPHTFAIVVLGGDDREIAEVLQSHKPVCVGMMGDVEVSLPNENPLYANRKDYNRDYKFYRTQAVPLKFDITLKLNNRSPNNFKQIVQSAVTDYISKIPIGGIVNQADLHCAILDYAKAGFVITSAKFSKKDEAVGIDPIELDFVELASVGLDDISVVGNR